MGLDGVELVMAFEEEFGIDIPDHVAAEMATPRHVVDYVAARLGIAGPASTCATRHTFHRVRAWLLRSLDVPRRSVGVETALATLVPRDRRRELWASAPVELVGPNWRMRRLLLPGWQFALLSALTVGAALAMSLPDDGAPWQARAFLGAVTAAGVGWVLAVATRPLRTEFPPGLATVGDLARYVASSPPPAAPAEGPRWTREQVALAVRRIVADETGVMDFTEDSHFVRDLGIS